MSSQPPRATDFSGSTGEVTRGSSIRPLSRLLGEEVAAWAFSGDGRLIFVSAGCGRWLNVAAENLIGRTGVPQSENAFDDPLDAICFSLRPTLAVMSAAKSSLLASTPNFAGSASDTKQAFIRLVSPAANRLSQADAAQPSRAAPQAPESRWTLFIPLPDDNATAYLAVAGVELQHQTELASEQFRGLIEAVQQQLAAEPRLLFSPVTIGGSVWAERLKLHVKMAAQTTAHVTIRCPQGGGGESLARLIHKQAIGTPTVGRGKVDLLQVAGSLMDAELFDATTGTLVNRLLDDATATAHLLVLDIDQMPFDAQERLALLLHNHAERLRVYATTTLEANALTVKLLTDLATQLGLIEIYVPTIAERIEDLPMMSVAMLQRRQAAGETAARQISRDALDRMILYPWPNNYEELDAAIRNAARQCRGETIHVEHLPLAIRTFGNLDTSSTPTETSNPKIWPLDQALADAERRFIKLALKRSNGNRAAAARLLDVSRGRLLRRIEQLGIDRDD